MDLSKYVDFSEICRVFGMINRMIDSSGIRVMEQLTLNESTGPQQFDISNMDSFQPPNRPQTISVDTV